MNIPVIQDANICCVPLFDQNIKHCQALYITLMVSGKLNSHLVEVDNQATEMFDRLMKQLAEKEGITEQLKAEDQMEWVQYMNNIRNRAEEIVNAEVILM